MGDRANIVITFESTKAAKTLKDALPGALVLYTHSGGYAIGSGLAQALLAAKPRWNDDSYAARIITSQIIGSSWDSEYGFGLYVGEIGDNERPILLVDLADLEVRRFGEAGKYLPPNEADAAVPTHTWSFAEFIETGGADAI